MSRCGLNLCRRHHSITSPAEFWEVLLVKAKSYWSGIRRDTILKLELELVEGGKIEVQCWPEQNGRLNFRGGFWRNIILSSVWLKCRSHSLHWCPTTLSRHRHCPDVPSQDMSTAPPTSHWQSRTLATFGMKGRMKRHQSQYLFPIYFLHLFRILKLP